MAKYDLTATTPLAADELERMDAWWRAANYFSVGHVYLPDNPLLPEPLTAAHVKPRLLGNFGMVPGLNLIYVYLNRVIKLLDLSVLFIAGPDTARRGVVASTWLEGTYTLSGDADGIRKLFPAVLFSRRGS